MRRALMLLGLVASVAMAAACSGDEPAPNSTRAYVGSENGSSVTVVDAMTHKVVETIPLSGQLVRPMGSLPRATAATCSFRPAAASPS